MKCKNCSKEFTEKYSKWSNGNFCSKLCSRSFASKKIVGSKIVQCIVCGKNIEVDKRSSDKLSKCDNCRKSKKYNKKIKIENQNSKKQNKKDIFCKHCNNKINSNRKRNFCSLRCYLDYEYNKRIVEWKTTKTFTGSGIYIPEYIRRYFFEKYDSKCSICGWGEINKNTNKIPLQVHHKDGNCLNNVEENLILLCPNCHSLTENYGSSNKGKGRKSKITELKKLKE